MSLDLLVRLAGLIGVAFFGIFLINQSATTKKSLDTAIGMLLVIAGGGLFIVTALMSLPDSDLRLYALVAFWLLAMGFLLWGLFLIIKPNQPF